jgi:hypothetical protein
MKARYAATITALAAVIAATIQLTSYALFGGIAAEPSIPALLRADWPFGVLAETGIARIPAVRRELARAALLRGDSGRAAALLEGAGAGDDAEDLRGRLAVATNDTGAALHHFGHAGDIVQARALIDDVAARDPAAALRLAEAFDAATAGRNIPAAVIAQSDWREGELAAAVAAQRSSAAIATPASAAATRLIRQSLVKYEAAARLDPTQAAYGLAVGFEAIVAGDAERSREAYGRVATTDPHSVDAAAGLAVADALTGACGPAAETYARAQALAANQHRVLDLAAAGYADSARSALSRCLAAAPPR